VISPPIKHIHLSVCKSAGNWVILNFLAPGDQGATTIGIQGDGAILLAITRGFVAESVSTGAMELHEHRFDLKKSAYKKQEGTEKDKQRAYKNAELLKPTNVLKYSVELKDSNILDTTRKGLTAIAKNTPKMIEKAARMDGYDGIIFKSMRGPGKNMVVYKNYHKIFTLHNKKKEVDDPTPFDKYDQGEMKEMLKHEEYERTGISKRLYEKGQQKGDGKAVRRPSFFNRFKNLFSGRR